MDYKRIKQMMLFDFNEERILKELESGGYPDMELISITVCFVGTTNNYMKVNLQKEKFIDTFREGLIETMKAANQQTKTRLLEVTEEIGSLEKRLAELRALNLKAV